MPTINNTLSKDERLHGRNAVEELFKKAGSRSMASFPLRAVFTLTDKDESDKASVKMLVSVPKRHFKRAVKRNRVKRQVREAYRKNKHSLCEYISMLEDRCLSIAFVWLDDNLHSSAEVEQKVIRLLQRIEEKLRHENGQNKA